MEEIIEMPKCPKCDKNKAVKKYGTKNGNKRFRCEHCEHCFTGKEKYKKMGRKEKEKIEEMLVNRVDLAKMGRILGYSAAGIWYQVKKN